MRKGLCLFGLLVGATLLWGCGPGMVKSPDERMNTYRTVYDTDMRQLSDDWDALWLADRQYRLTKWQTR